MVDEDPRAVTPPPGGSEPTVVTLPTGRRRFLPSLRQAVLLLALASAVATVGIGVERFARRNRWDARLLARPTTSVVVAVRDLARLETAEMHIERVIDLTDRQERLFGLVQAEDAILLVAAADVVAGVDLSELEEQDVQVDNEGRAVRLTLPTPRVLSTRLDSDRTYVHTRRTDALARRREDLETRARQEAERSMEAAALEAGLLDRARTNSGRTVEALVRSLGFRRVEIRWAPSIARD